jgi:hypothetical protein
MKRNQIEKPSSEIFELVDRHMVISIASQKGGGRKNLDRNILSSWLARGERKPFLSISTLRLIHRKYFQELPTAASTANYLHNDLERKALPVHPIGSANLVSLSSHILVSNADIALTTAQDHREAD